MGNISWGVPDFANCYRGIITRNAETFITDNIMEGVTYGVTVGVNHHRRIEISGNEIHTNKIGIKLLNNGAVEYANIKNNLISVQPRSCEIPSYGIKIEENGLAPLDYYILNGNHIILDQFSRFGIYLNNTRQVIAMENTIEMEDPDCNIAGFYLTGNIFDTLTCNYIYGVDPASGDSATHAPIGISVTESPRCGYYFNELYDTYTGVYFAANCEGTDFRRTSFHEHSYGLYYEDNAITSPQEEKANKWLDNCLVYGALHVNQNYLPSIYTVGTGCNVCWPAPNWNPFNWFTLSQNPTPSVQSPCASQMAMQMPEDSLLDIAYLAIAQNQLEFPVFDEELSWNAVRYLFDRIIREPGLLDSHPLLVGFYDSAAVISPGIYQDIEVSQRQVQEIPEELKELNALLKDQLYQAVDSLRLIDSILSLPLSSGDSSLFAGKRQNLAVQFSTIRAMLNNTSAAYLEGRNQLAAELRVINSTAPENTLYEANEKTVNDIYLSTIATGISLFTEDQADALLSIASQCPLAGGKSVYKARSLYSLVTDTLFDDYSSCRAEEIKRLHQQIKRPQDVSCFRIFPNPASSSLTLKSGFSEETLVTLTIQDISGKTVFQNNLLLTGQAVTIPLGDLIPGCYLLQVRNDYSVNFTGKFILIR